MIQFSVLGMPRPAGSKRAFTYRKPTGQVGVRVADMSGQKGVRWRKAVQQAAIRAMSWHRIETGAGGLVTGALGFVLICRLPRPKHHLTKKGKRTSKWRAWPTGPADATKLCRAVEDALTGIVWKDDAQICQQSVTKVYADDRPVGIDVLVSELEGI